MKIAFILKHFFYYSAQLIEELAANTEIHLFLDAESREVFQTEDPGQRKREISTLFPQNVHMYFFRSRFRVQEFFSFAGLAFRLKRLRPDVIHVHRSFARINLYYWIIKTFFCPSAAFVLTVHDVTFHPGEGSCFERLTGFSHAMVYRSADRIILHGHELKRRLLNAYPHLEEKVHVLPHGELSIYKRWEGKEKRDLLRNQETNILCFGRMTPYKDLDTLIEAGKILYKKMDSFRIIFAGQGPVMKQKKDEIQKYPFFLCMDHYIPNEMVAYLFSRSDVVALPYIEASQSGVVALAYAFRKPVVATEVGALSESIVDGKTGLLVPPGRPDQMAHALERLVKDRDLRNRMGRHIKKWVDESLSWKRIANQTMTLYRMGNYR